MKHAQAASSSQNTFAARRMYHETYSTLTFYKKHHAIYLPVILFVRTPARLLALILKFRFKELGLVVKATIDFLLQNNSAFTAPVVTAKRYFRFQ